MKAYSADIVFDELFIYRGYSSLHLTHDNNQVEPCLAYCSVKITVYVWASLFGVFHHFCHYLDLKDLHDKIIIM